jgi:integrase
VINDEGGPLNLSRLVVPLVGSLETTGVLFHPYRLVDDGGVTVGPVSAFFAELAACGRPATTQRSYGMDLLRWFRFLWALEVPWDQATRIEARDFIRWLQIAVKPDRPHWRYPTGGAGGSGAEQAAARVNAVTGKPSHGDRYEAATVAHCESVLRGFYDFHLEAGTGPMLNPFPMARHARLGRAGAHHNPMDPFDRERRGRYRPKVVARAPRSIPDGRFDALFALLGSHRDRALVAFWVSTGARASELLGATAGDVDSGQQLITVMRKGTRVLQPLPDAPDAFVWLRLYQTQLSGLVPTGRDEPLWWTLRRPLRALGYDAARVMFTRANAALGSNWSLHDLRHTAAYRMARDPQMPLTDVQWVLGHARLRDVADGSLAGCGPDLAACPRQVRGRVRFPSSAAVVVVGWWPAEGAVDDDSGGVEEVLQVVGGGAEAVVGPSHGFARKLLTLVYYL